MNERVSIVIVARNEEAKIADCIRSANEAAAEIGGADVIVADSASTDRTAAISLQLGATVVRLRPDWELSASAGRHIGTNFSQSEFILFVDADTIVRKGFMSRALAEFAAEKRLAGVCGYLDDANEGHDELLVFEERPSVATNISWMRGGCCFYRRSAILDVGSFNPYLLAEEEAEIGIRLTRAGWKLRMIPVPMAVHTRCTEDLSGKSIFTHLTRLAFAGRFGGTTRTLGYALRNGYGWQFCRLRMATVIFFGIWISMLVLLEAIPSHALHIAGLYAAFLGFVAILLKKGSIKRTLLFFVAKFMYMINLMGGITKVRFTPTEEYPLDYEVLRSDASTVAMSQGATSVKGIGARNPEMGFSYE